MDSTNNINNTKAGKELDIRDAISYLFSKIWIIALVVAATIIVAFLITNFTTELFTSTNKAMLINKNEQSETDISDKLNASDLTIAIQLTKMSSEIFTSDSFAVRVAEMLNNDEGSFTNCIELIYNDNQEPVAFKNFYGNTISIEDGKQVTFKDFYGGEIGFTTVKSSLKVNSNEDTCAVTLSSTTTNPNLSALIVTASYECMQDHINENFKVESIIVGQVDYGRVPKSPSNIHYFRNMAIGAVLGAVAISAILLAFYIFDDKIKTPDDVEKHLGLSVLGEIPEIEEEAWGDWEWEI